MLLVLGADPAPATTIVLFGPVQRGLAPAPPRTVRLRLHATHRTGRAALLLAPRPGEVDHRALIASLCDQYPDGWALSTGASQLWEVLALCPSGARVLAWVKPPLSPKPSVGIQFSWEPLILHRGRRRYPLDGIILDRCSRSALREGQLIGAKSREFCIWLFRCLGAKPGDQLADLYPGTGGVTNAWNDLIRKPPLHFSPRASEPQLEIGPAA